MHLSPSSTKASIPNVQLIDPVPKTRATSRKLDSRQSVDMQGPRRYDACRFLTLTCNPSCPSYPIDHNSRTSPIHLLPQLPRYEPGSTHQHRHSKELHLEHVGVDQEVRRQNRIALSCSGLGTPNATARPLLEPTRPHSLNAIITSHFEVSISTLFAITLSRGSTVFLRKPSCQASLGNHRMLQIQVKSGQTTLKMVSADPLVIAGSQTPLHRLLQPSGRWVFDGYKSSPRENTIRKETSESGVLDSDVGWSLRCPDVGFEGVPVGKGEHPSDHIVATKYVSTVSDLERVKGILW
ncbi:Myo-inositol-1-phosphate synthase [Marasmius sp. AFHP31]|nr:Myo-inositol-1-phosphate synthase [Marasmius sp. AFHP31]